MTRLELPLPVPPRFDVKRRAPTLRHKAYLRAAAASIARQKPALINGPVSVYVSLVAPDQHARDTGHLGTTFLDTLKANGLIDGAVRRLTFEWAEDGPGEWAEDGPGEWAEDDKWAEDRPRCVVLIQQEVAA